jgi:phage terminase small subunit
MEQAETDAKPTTEQTAEAARRIEVEDALSVISTLSGLQRRFLVEYLSAEKPNATAAAERVGYKTPNKQGPRLLQNPKIRAAIDEYFHAYEMSAREVIARLSDQARGSLGDFLDIGSDYEPTLNLGKARREGKLHLLKKFKQKKVTYVNKDDEETVTEWIEVELHDPQAALAHVGRYHGLFTDKTDITSGGEVIKPNIYLPDNGRDNGRTSEADDA